MIKKLFRFRLKLFDVQMVNVELFSALGENLLFLVSFGASSFSLAYIFLMKKLQKMS